MHPAEAFSVEGKVVVITGGGTGLGLGMAQTLVAAGACVVLTGRREDVLQAATATLGLKTTYYVHNIAEVATSPDLVERIEAEVGPIDVLINNAGINLKKPIAETTDAQVADIIQTNVLGVYALTRAVSANMIPRKSGSIIMISSMAALYGLSYVSAYGASKAAVAGMTRVLASELSPHGIRVNAIAPGFIESPMLHKALEADPARKAKILGRTPMGSFGSALDIGYAALYLASPAARFVTGITLPVDGGNSIGF